MKTKLSFILVFTLALVTGCQSPPVTSESRSFDVKLLTGLSYAAADDSRWITKYIVALNNSGNGVMYRYTHDRSDGASYYEKREIEIHSEGGLVQLISPKKGIRLKGSYGQVAGAFSWPLGYDEQRKVWYSTKWNAHIMGRIEFASMQSQGSLTDQEAIKFLEELSVTTTPTRFMQIAAGLRGTSEVLGVARDTVTAYENAKSGNSGKINPSNSLSQATLTSIEMSAYTDGYAYNVQTLIPAQTMGEFIVYYGVPKETAQSLLETGYSIAGDRSEYGPGNPQTTISWQRVKVGVGSRISVGSESQAGTMPPRKFGNPYHTTKP